MALTAYLPHPHHQTTNIRMGKMMILPLPPDEAAPSLCLFSTFDGRSFPLMIKMLLPPKIA